MIFSQPGFEISADIYPFSNALDGIASYYKKQGEDGQYHQRNDPLIQESLNELNENPLPATLTD